MALPRGINTLWRVPCLYDDMIRHNDRSTPYLGLSSVHGASVAAMWPVGAASADVGCFAVEFAGRPTSAVPVEGGTMHAQCPRQ